jgi:hypothetical protein
VKYRFDFPPGGDSVPTLTTESAQMVNLIKRTRIERYVADLGFTL